MCFLGSGSFSCCVEAALCFGVDVWGKRTSLRDRDVLLQVGRKKVTEPEDVLDASFFITAGDVVPITVLRGNQKLTFNVRAGFHPASQHGVLIASPASPTINQAIPLKLDSEAQRTP